MPDSSGTDPVGTPATAADVELARTGLLEITAADTIGEPQGSIDEGDGVVTVYFGTNLAGYPGWRWTVSIAHVEGEQPTVLETELTPGDGALLSPAWVPWVDRLAEYQAAQEDAASAEEGVDSDDESDDDDDLDDEDEDEDDDESDDDDDDDLGSDVLHGGDLDGVDIDDLDDTADDDDDEDDDADEGDDESDDRR